MFHPTIMKCPVKPEKPNTGLTTQGAKHVYTLIQKRLNKNAQETAQAIGVDLKQRDMTLLSVKRSMQEPVSATELPDSKHGQDLSFFFVLTATTKPWNITMRITTFGGLLNLYASAATPIGIM